MTRRLDLGDKFVGCALDTRDIGDTRARDASQLVAVR